MSKPTDSFWHGLGWAFIWIAFFGGIALIIWANNHFGGQNQRLCIQEHGTWQWDSTGTIKICKFK